MIVEEEIRGKQATRTRLLLMLLLEGSGDDTASQFIYLSSQEELVKETLLKKKAPVEHAGEILMADSIVDRIRTRVR